MLKPIEKELAIIIEGHKVLIKIWSSYQNCWSFCGSTAQSSLCTPGRHTRGAGNPPEGLQCAQRLPVILPEVVVIPAKDFSSINTAVVNELNVLELFGVTNTMSWMIDSWSQIGGDSHTYREPLYANYTQSGAVYVP